jgi:EAL domain-containing protein (putative c-di-GMP-specific phosphodiesterase class I)
VILIPESLTTGNSEGNLRVTQSLKELGIKVGVSQFGTGFSSLSILRKFDFSHIFIDNSFLNGADNEKDGFAILKAICSLANSLKITLAIDSVETQNQEMLLKSVGCQLAASKGKVN